MLGHSNDEGAVGKSITYSNHLPETKRVEIMADNFDRHKVYNSQAKQSQDQRKPGGKPRPTGDRGPYFLPKLLDKEITIHLITGQEIRGKLKGFNSYELLIEPKNSGELSLVFRSAIANVNFKAELADASKNKSER